MASGSSWYVPLQPIQRSASPNPAPVSEEQSCLEEYFHCLGQFHYDKAKEILDKHRDCQKSNPHSVWPQMVVCLNQLLWAEKTYSSLIFLTTGISLFGPKKDGLRQSYDSLYREFRRLDEHVSRETTPSKGGVASSGGGSSSGGGAYSSAGLEKLLAHLGQQLSDFVTARVKMMNYYDQMATMGTMKWINFEDLLTVITDIVQTSQKSFHHPIMGPLKTAFGTECDINSHLLECQIKVSIWQFLPSLLHLHEAHIKLNTWAKWCHAKETKMLGFGSRQPTEPVLYTWLCKLKAILVAKFSLYFYETLSRQTPAASTDMKALTAKCSVDFYGKITAFQKKTDAKNISLVYNVDGIQDLYQGPGYHHPNKVTEKPKGLSSYPAIFSYPSDQLPPDEWQQVWPNVISLICQRENENAPDKTIYFYDKKVDNTYFLSRIETRITFVVIFGGKRAEKDSYIQNFMTDLSCALRLTKLLQSLRTGSK